MKLKTNYNESFLPRYITRNIKKKFLQYYRICSNFYVTEKMRNVVPWLSKIRIEIIPFYISANTTKLVGNTYPY